MQFVRYQGEDTNAVIASWLRNRNTIEFLGTWEKINNPNFKPHEFEGFRKAEMIKNNMPQSIRLKHLNKIALEQLDILQKNNQKALQQLKLLN